MLFGGFEDNDLSGRILLDHLAGVQATRSRNVAVVISGSYVTKTRPNNERQHALRAHRGKAVRASEQFVATEIPGLDPTVGHVDATSLTAVGVVGRMMTKLRPSRMDAPSWRPPR